MPLIHILPSELDRSTAQEKLGPQQAAILQHVDLQTIPGRILRGAGCSRTDMTSSSSTLTAAEVFIRNDCRRVVVDSPLRALGARVPAW